LQACESKSNRIVKFVSIPSPISLCLSTKLQSNLNVGLHHSITLCVFVFLCHDQSLKGMHNFRTSGEYDNDCSTPLTPLCTQPEQVIKGERPSVFARTSVWP